MTTNRQKLGDEGEELVKQNCYCPKCKSSKKTLKLLPKNYKCADVICEFCGYLAQIKTTHRKDINLLPNSILGGAWGVHKQRMDAGIFFPLFLVLIDDDNNFAIYYLSADLQPVDMFKPRKKLSENARRAGWQGFTYDIQQVASRFVRLV